MAPSFARESFARRLKIADAHPESWGGAHQAQLMDMRSLPRDEVCRQIGLSAEALDALIDSGHLLCQVRRGEVRIPLEQLEKFFHDGLMRVYRATVAPEEVVAPPPPKVEVREEPQPEPEAPPEEPQPEPIAAMDVLPPPEATEEREEEEDTESRSAPRFIPRRQIDGIFGDCRFTIVQISTSGLRIRHVDELIPGTEAKLSFALLRPPRSFVMRARVVWTSVARVEGGERTFYISGLRMTEHVDRLEEAVGILRKSHELQPDRRELPRFEIDEAVAQDASSAMVIRALHHFADDPLDAARFYSRARFSLSDAQVRRDAPRKPGERDEVLAIWEYLERQVPIAKIVETVAAARRASKSVTL